MLGNLKVTITIIMACDCLTRIPTLLYDNNACLPVPALNDKYYYLFASIYQHELVCYIRNIC